MSSSHVCHGLMCPLTDTYRYVIRHCKDTPYVGELDAAGRDPHPRTQLQPKLLSLSGGLLTAVRLVAAIGGEAARVRQVLGIAQVGADELAVLPGAQVAVLLWEGGLRVAFMKRRRKTRCLTIKLCRCLARLLQIVIMGRGYN